MISAGAAIAVVGVAMTACVQEQPIGPVVTLDTQDPQAPEGEFIGNLYVDGVKSSEGASVSLVPWDSVTSSRLREPHNTTMWGNPALPRMWEWYDPKAGGGCGDLSHYLVGDTSTRYPEGHWSGPASPPDPSQTEKHCIRPGVYRFTVAETPYLVDYLPIVPVGPGGALQVWNATAGVYEVVEDRNPNDTANVWADLVANVDIGPTTYSEGRVLLVENANEFPESAWFADDPSPSGNEQDYFRFSVAGSSSTWPVTGGKALARLYWDFARSKTSWLTNYYDPFSPAGRVIRIHKFQEHVDETRDAIVALELMRPDESPGDTLNVATRSIQLTRLTPIACAWSETPGYLSTWRVADQYLSAGCSSVGSNIRYRWQPYYGAPWTGWSADTLYDFPGHTQSGTRIVGLQVQDLATQQTSSYTLTFAVSSSQVLLSGPTYIQDKKSKLYTAGGHNGQWFERYDDGLQRYPATYGQQTTMTRIWPAGDYTVELRQHRFAPEQLLQRGRLHIIVCSSPGCQPNGAIVPTGGASPQLQLPDWGLFGAGPWISWSDGAVRRVLRLYDLWGMHEAENPFVSADWFERGTGRFTDPATGWTVTWERQETGIAEARAFRITVSQSSPAAFVFGMGVDPDLGEDAADDAASWDGGRGLVLVADGERTVGLMLRDASGRDALASVQEYGVGRWAPTTPDVVWAAQRAAGTRLIGTPRDVQLVLSAGETTGEATWIFTVIRGTFAADVRERADALLGAR